MGFPVGYTEIFIPTLIIHTLTLFLTLFKKLLNTLFNYIGIPPDCLQPDPIEIHTHTHTHTHSQPDPTPPVRALLLRELLPLRHVPVTCVGERCAICLYEYCGGEETRWLWNCKHVFHRECIDRWIDLDHTNCPLCRTPFLLDGLLREFDQRLLFLHHHHGFDHYGFDNHFNMHVDI